MELVFFLFIVSVVYSTGQAKKEWLHHRDTYAKTIKQNNPDWHPRKVRRHARSRALTWWSLEAVKGFPSIRRAWAEDRDHVRYLRETARISSETRIEELRAELDAIRKGREEHDTAKREGRTQAPFGTWYQQHAARIREGKPDPKAGVLPKRSAEAPPSAKTVPSPAPAAQVPNRTEDDQLAGYPILQQLQAALQAGRIEDARKLQDAAHWAGLGDKAQQLIDAARNNPPQGVASQSTEPGSSEPLAGSSFTGELNALLDAAEAQDESGAPGSQTPQAPGQEAGTPNPDSNEQGDSMTIPNGELAGDSPYRAAFTALEQYERAAEQHKQAGEVLEAQLTMHGFDRDQQLMEHIRGMQESAMQISSRTVAARQTLIANHGQGEEYHRSGVDANSSAFRND